MSADSQHAAWVQAMRCLPAPNDLTARTDPTRHIERIETDDTGGAFSEYQDRIAAKLSAEFSHTALQLGLTSHRQVAAEFDNAVANAASSTGMDPARVREDALAMTRVSPFSAIDCVCEIVAQDARTKAPFTTIKSDGSACATPEPDRTILGVKGWDVKPERGPGLIMESLETPVPFIPSNAAEAIQADIIAKLTWQEHQYLLDCENKINADIHGLDTALQAEQRHVAELKTEAQALIAERNRQQIIKCEYAASCREIQAGHDAALAAAAKQFRMITGDFPGLTGPLVDLFKDVK